MTSFTRESGLRDDFIIPVSQINHKQVSYFEGHSLGLQPKIASSMVMKFMDEWAQHGVDSWFKHGWLEADLNLSNMMSPLLGTKPQEITFTSGLTENIHKLVSTFYKPQGKRNKIITIQNEFSSDIYAIQSQIELKGLNHKECMISVAVDQLYSEKATNDLIEAIVKNKDSTSIVWFSMVNYLTSVKFDVEKIAKVCHQYGIHCLIDLAHAAGCLPLDLHKWQIDGAVWCSYKYLNSGPGCLGGIYMHKNHEKLFPGMRGWHGNSRKTQFLMRADYEPESDARKFQISNYDPGQVTRVEAGLSLFHKAGGMEKVRERNVKLTDYLVKGLQQLPKLKILSPLNEQERGSHLSIVIENTDMKEFKQVLSNEGVLGDLRRFDEHDNYLMRISPVGLYITYEDIDRVVQVLDYVLNEKKEKFEVKKNEAVV
eukprot:403369408